jgi:hypothetical protein
MSKQKKGNRESKKTKAVSENTKKEKKDPRRYDGNITGSLGGSK